MASRCLACIVVALMLAACQGQGTAPSVARRPSPPPQMSWRALAAPLPQGYRGVIYDATRGSYWILSRQLDGHGAHVVLQRFDPTLDAWFATSVQLDATAYRKAIVQLARDGRVWLGWGRTLARYDPTTDRMETWPLPPDSAGYWSTDGAMLAMLLASDGELWIAAEPVHAIFGFDTRTSRWDRKIALPFEPTDWSRLVEVAPGQMLINGVFIRGNAVTSLLAKVDTTRSTATLLPPHAGDYLLAGQSIVYVDDSSTLRTFNPLTGVDSLVAALPVTRPDALALDAGGHLWFSVGAYRYLGIGRVNLTSGSLTTYPFPYIDRPGQHNTKPNTCPPNSFDCIPADAVPGVQVQAISVDPRGTVWVFTDMGGTTTDFRTSPAPLYAFRAPDAP